MSSTDRKQKKTMNTKKENNQNKEKSTQLSFFQLNLLLFLFFYERSIDAIGINTHAHNNEN
jgi:hypothetical protein